MDNKADVIMHVVCFKLFAKRPLIMQASCSKAKWAIIFKLFHLGLIKHFYQRKTKMFFA